MKLNVWIDKECKARSVTLRTVLDELVTTSGVSLVTVRSAARGMRLKKYDVAKSLSEATGGKVKIADLCDETSS